MATEVVNIIDPDNGSGTDYTSLSAWEAGEQGDLTGVRDEIAVATCRCTGGTADTTAVTIEGWTTSATQYIKIWTDPSESYRHSGKWETGNKYTLRPTTVGNYLGYINIVESYVRVIGLQIDCSVDSAFSARGISAPGSSTSIIIIDKCIIRYSAATATTNYQVGIAQYPQGEAVTLIIANTIIYGFKTQVRNAGIDGKNSSSNGVYIYNCTISDCYVGVYESANEGEITSINTICFNNVDDFYGGSQNYCASDDNDGTNPVNISPGGTESTDWEGHFVDYANKDFHLKSGSNLIAAATNLYADETYAFQDDIDGDDRGGSGANWDIGADEYVLAAKAIPPFILSRQRDAFHHMIIR